MKQQITRMRRPQIRSTLQWSLPIATFLVLMVGSPTASASLTDTCTVTVDPHKPCPGATPLGKELAFSFDETSPRGNQKFAAAVLTLGDVVFCDGFALPGNAGCDSQGISDILRFSVGEDLTETKISWLSDLSNEGGTEFGKPDAGTNNGSDQAVLQPKAGLVLYFTEAGLAGGVEKNIYIVDNGFGNTATYTLISDNPEPSTFVLMLGGTLLITTVRSKRARLMSSRRPVKF